MRFHEADGLLPQPAREGNGYRDYPPSAVDRVDMAFIRQAQASGLTLRQIGEILACATAGERPADMPPTWSPSDWPR